MNISLINTINQKGLILETLEEKDSVVKKTLLDLGGVIDGTFTFGVGITAMLPVVKELMTGTMPTLTEQDVVLLYIAAMWILVGRHQDKIQKLLNIIRERGLTDGLSVVLDFLKSVEDVSIKIGNSLGYTVNSLVDIVAFTFLAFPIIDGLLFLINQGLINPGSPTGYLKSVLVGVGIIGFKNVFNHIIKKLGGKLKSLDEGRENLNEQSNFYNETLEMVGDVISLVKKSTTNPNVETYYLPEDLRPDEIIYEIDNYMFTLELTISRDEDIKDEFHLEAYYVGDDTIEIGLTINPLMEPESYIHIEDYLTEYIRHEIRHAEQEVMGTPLGKIKKDLKGLEYYTQDHEIDAQTSGLNARRLKQDRSFEETIRGAVENTKLRHGLSDDEGEQLYDILLKDITERYGKDSLHEAKGPKKNIPLDIGDEVLLISIDKTIFPAIPWRTTRPESTQLYLPYIVTAVIHRQPQNWESPDDDTTVYKVTQKNLEDRALYSDTFIVSGKDDWIMNPGYRRGGWEEEQELRRLQEQKEPTKDIPKKVVLDNEDYRVYVPLRANDLCRIPDTDYCNNYNSVLKFQASMGTPYIIEFKKRKLVPAKNSNQLLFIDRGKIPLLREPGSQKSMYNTAGRVENHMEVLSQEKELQKFFHLKYSLSERIKYNMEFDEGVLLDGKNHSKLGALIYNINNNTGDPEELVDYFGDFEEYSESYYNRGGEDEIEIVPDGINVYLKKDDWIQNVLELGEGSYYYDLAHDNYYGDHYDEVDEDELNYMSCWFNDSQLKKVTELMNLFEGTDKPLNRLCYDIDEGEIADFFEKYFPQEWNNFTPDLLYEVGAGIGKQRIVALEEWFKDEIYLEYDHIGGDSVMVHIGWEPLLYLVTQHLPSTENPDGEGGTLDILFSEDKAINSLSGDPADWYYESNDWAEGTEEEVESIIDTFLEKVDGVDTERRKDFINKVNGYLKKEKFDSQNWGMYTFIKKYGDRITPDRVVGVRKLDTEDETIHFEVTTPNPGEGTNRESYVKSFEDFVTYVQSPTIFEP